MSHRHTTRGERTDRGVTRRRFIQATGATGAVAAFSGYARAQDDTTVVQFASDSLANDNSETLQQALYDAGLSENIELDIIAGAWETGRRQNQYQQWLSAGRNEPDLLMMDSGWTQPFIARKQVQNMSDLLPSDLQETVNSDYQARAVDSVTGPEGDLYGVPMFLGVPTMNYRKDLVEDAGYDTSGWQTEPLSWEEFSQVTSDVLDQNDDIDYGFTFQGKAYEGLACCNFNEWMSSYGGAYFGDLDNLFGPIGDRPITINQDQVVRSLRMVRTFINGSDDPVALDGFAGDIAPEAVLQWSEEPSRQPFTNGNAVMHRNWPYAININGSEDEGFGEDLGTMPIPSGVSPDEAEYEGTGGAAAALGGWNLTVNPNSQKKDAVVEVIEAMSTDSYQAAQFEAVGWLPPKPAVYDSETVRNVPVLGRYIDTIKVSVENAIPRPATAVWPQESEQIAQTVNSVLAQESEPAPALDQLAATVEQIEQSV
ncbi:extracellular solute-binding protein [Halorussus marinus]|uniref:extracellular solute-binding protein n=1 Tax=Halorussus marinus TaxID=2505976 RepID=UPI001092A4E3|nr:extracellular solute-binding protein [Halorussus marinus]